MALSRPHDPFSPHVPVFREPPPQKRPQVAADEAEAGRAPEAATETPPVTRRRAQPPKTRRRAAPRKQRRAGKVDS